MATLILEDIHKRFDQTVIIDSLNLTVNEGEFIVLVGPSGCGKSTILRLIAGLETPTHGRIHIDHQLVNDLPPKDRDIAMVFQNYALYPHMTVYNNLAFGLKMRKTPKALIQQKVAAIAEMLQLGPLLQRKPKQLSGGQRQRVALGRAMVRNPKIYLMDEPLSNLDAQLRSQTRGEIMRLHHQLKTTTVYVTHDQTEAMTMGDRMVLLNGGVIQQIGPPLTLYQSPANPFVANFLGQISWLPLIRHEGQTWKLSQSEVSVTLPDSQTVWGQSIRVGIRPEQFSVIPDEQHDFTLTVQYERSELLGREKLLYATWYGHSLIAQVPPDWEGETLYVKWDPRLIFPTEHSLL